MYVSNAIWSRGTILQQVGFNIPLRYIYKLLFPALHKHKRCGAFKLIENHVDSMTYVVGWKSKSSVYICADSVVTVSAHQPREDLLIYKESTFGEKMYFNDSKHTTESICKIENINEKVIIAFSGEVGVAQEIIDYFRRTLERYNDYTAQLIKDSFITSINESDSDEKVHKVSFIIGLIDFDNPILMSYNRGGNRALTEHSIVQIGSLSDSTTYRYITNKLYADSTSLDEDCQLIVISAVLQSYGFHEKSIIENYGVGGFILGVQLKKTGVTWNDDTFFFLYSGTFKDFVARPMTLFIRENVVFARGAASRKIIGDIPTKWHGSNPNVLFDSLMPSQYKYIVFLSAIKRKITILKTESFNDQSRFANIKDPNSVNPTFYITRNFFRHLINYRSFENISTDFIAIETTLHDDERIDIPSDPNIFAHYDLSNGGEGHLEFSGQQWMYTDFDSPVRVNDGFAWFGEINFLNSNHSEEKVLYQIGNNELHQSQFSIGINKDLHVFCKAVLSNNESISIVVSDFKGVNLFEFFTLCCVLKLGGGIVSLQVYLNNQLAGSTETAIEAKDILIFNRQVIGGDMEGKRNAAFNIKEQFITIDMSPPIIQRIILYFENRYRKLFFYPKK
jgi:ATP-dependent protease HslVU (ClpYQ) peptidase subunit